MYSRVATVLKEGWLVVALPSFMCNLPIPDDLLVRDSLSKVLCKYLAVSSIVIFVLGKIYIFHMYCLFFITCLSFLPDSNTLCQNHNTVKKKKAWLFFVVKRETD